MYIEDTKVIEQFEKEVAKYSNSKYAVTISSGTNGLFLSLELLKHKGILKEGDTIEIPKRTYMSVPMSCLNSHLNVKFRDERWSGAYPLVHIESGKTVMWDSATRFTKDMFQEPLYVLSLQYRKLMPVGRGGLVLTNNKEYCDLLKKLRFNGRSEGISQADDVYTIRGHNMYLTPESAARGMTLLSLLPEKNKDIAGFKDYPDLSLQELFNE